MGKTIRLLAVILAVITVLSVVAAILPVSASADDEDVRFKEKIVSVLYDNSGSMDDEVGRLENAQYALGMLTALLNTDDTLVITPMNVDGNSVTRLDQSIEVVLKDESKRNQLVQDLLKDSVFGAKGTTPAGPLDLALQHLYDRGYTNEDVVGSNKEYWLVIMSDGDFDGVASMEDYIGSYVQANKNMNIVFMSMGAGATDLTKSPLTEKINFSAYYSETAADICNDMQKIANRLSGRYTLPQTALSVSGDKVSIDLSSCRYAVRSVSIVAQNCGAALEKVTHGSKEVPFKQGCSITLAISNDYKGYSAVIEGAPLFEGGSIELDFNGNVDDALISVMVEPALYVQAIPLAMIDGEWTPVDAQYISKEMKAGQNIRLSYQVYEEGSGEELQLEELFGSCTATVTVNGTPYAVGQDIPLQVGQNAIKMMVSVLNNAYTVPSYLYCFVEREHTDFRVEAALTKDYQGVATKTNSTYTVFVNNQALDSRDDFSQFKKIEAYVVCNGEPENLPYTIDDNGKVSIEYDTANKPYGTYQVVFKVTSVYDASREGITTFSHYPASILLVNDGKDTLSMTHHAFKSNTEGFSFLLKADCQAAQCQGASCSDANCKDLIFANGFTQLTVTYNGKNVTDACVIEGNRLTFTPTFANTELGIVGEGGITEKVVVSISSETKPTLTDTAEASVTILPTVYEIIPIEGEQGEINRFKLSQNEVSAYFAVKRDGEFFTQEELQAAIDAGELTVHSKYFESGIRPFTEVITTEVVDGVAVARYCVKEGHAGFFRYLFTTMLCTKKGDHAVNASYMAQGLERAETGDSKIAIAPLTAANWFDYLFRILLIVILIWLIHVAVVVATVFRLSPRHPRGRFIKITPDIADSESPKVDYSSVNIKTKSRFIPKRLAFMLRAPQADKSFGEVKIHVTKESTSQIFLTRTRCNCILFSDESDLKGSEAAKSNLEGFIALVARNQTPKKIEALTSRELTSLFPYNAMVFRDDTNSSNALRPGHGKNISRTGRSVYLALYEGGQLKRVYCFVPLRNQ